MFEPNLLTKLFDVNGSLQQVVPDEFEFIRCQERGLVDEFVDGAGHKPLAIERQANYGLVAFHAVVTRSFLQIEGGESAFRKLVQRDFDRRGLFATRWAIHGTSSITINLS